MESKLIIFDLDGTLLDTSPGFFSSIAETARKNGLKEPDAEELRTFIGPPIQDSFKRFYSVSAEEADALAADFRDDYANRTLLMATPYPGIFEAIETLIGQGHKIAVCTYKRQSYALPLLDHFGFTRYTGLIYGSDSENKFTKSDLLAQCIAESGFEKQNALLVGDTGSDLKAAADVGIPLVAATYGFGFTEDNIRGIGFPLIASISSPSQLPTKIQTLS